MEYFLLWKSPLFSIHDVEAPFMIWCSVHSPKGNPRNFSISSWKFSRNWNCSEICRRTKATVWFLRTKELRRKRKKEDPRRPQLHHHRSRQQATSQRQRNRRKSRMARLRERVPVRRRLRRAAPPGARIVQTACRGWNWCGTNFWKMDKTRGVATRNRRKRLPNGNVHSWEISNGCRQKGVARRTWARFQSVKSENRRVKFTHGKKFFIVNEDDEDCEDVIPVKLYGISEEVFRTSILFLSNRVL